jgi:hypothetical protein
MINPKLFKQFKYFVSGNDFNHCAKQVIKYLEMEYLENNAKIPKAPKYCSCETPKEVLFWFEDLNESLRV